MTNILHTPPYFDDFDSNKGFQQVLFKPSRPVQARELNTLQSILHNQTHNLSEHIFKHGTRVNGISPTHTVVNYITLDLLSPFDGLSLNLNRILGCKKLQGQTSKIEAILLNSVPSIGADPTTLYVKYTLTAIDNKTFVFLDGEIVNVVDANDIVTYSFKVRCPTCVGSQDNITLKPTGLSVLWQIPESTYYAQGYFVDIATTTVIGEKYTNGIESYTVGLDIVSDIITSDDDSSLYDNALGYPNYRASGADRYRIRLVPIVRTNNIEDGENFITLARVVKGVVTFVMSRTEYASLMDMLAERTYDESGNYTVVPFKVSFKEHLAKTKDDPKGIYTLADGGDENKFVAIASLGKAYVLGYQVDKISETYCDFEKARDTRKIAKYYNKIGSLNYILIKPLVNSSFFSTDTTKVDLFTNESINLYDNVASGGLPTGTIIGTIKPYDVVYDSGTGVDKIYKLYFADMTMNTSKTYDLVKTLSASGTVTFLCEVVNDTTSLKPKVYDSDTTCLIWNIGKRNVKSIRDNTNNTQSSFTFTTRKKFVATLDSLGKYTWTTGTGEYFDSFSNTTTLVSIINNDNTCVILVPTNELTINSSTMNVDLGSGNAGKKIEIIHSIIKTNAIEKTKTLSTHTITNGVLDTNRITTTKCDLSSVVSIFKFNPTTPTLRVDVKEFFTWNTGQSDIAYVPIVFTKSASAPTWATNDNFEIVFKYYEHSSTGDYFSVDSYSTIVNDNSIVYGYEDIPSYTSLNGVVYDLKSCIDFRPNIIDASLLSTTQPIINGSYNTDCEIYLPRTDLLVIDKNGNIYQKKGISSDYPVPPKADDKKEMALYTIIMNPFVYNIENDVKLQFVENKRYTMRDIGRIDNRLKNVEYYTAFSLLESKTADMAIKDTNGFDRFKNGFVVDNFQNYQAADLTLNEFNAALDRKHNELRPPYDLIHSDLSFDSTHSSNFKQLGNVLMIDYNEETFIEQPFASKSISVNPYFIFERKGVMILSPAFDNWANVDVQPSTVVNIDTGIEALSQLASKSGMIGTEWGAWSDINSTIIDTSYDFDPARAVGQMKIRNDTLQTEQTRSGVQTTMETRTNSYNLGDRVTDVKLVPFMRSTDITFFAKGMKPNTRVYCYFDGVDVTENCRPSILTTQGTPILVNSGGNCTGIFRIPANRFYNGQKTFRLTNDKNNSKDEDLVETTAESIYWAGGIDVVKQSTTLNVVTPSFVSTPVPTNDSRTVTTTRQSNPYDPLAQTFTVDEDCFLTAIDVYFQNIDVNDKPFIQIKNTENGYPGALVLNETKFTAAEVKVSETALLPTKITFPYPVFVQGNKDYAVVVGGESPDTRVWISKLGGNDVTHPNILIDKQPSLGSLFKSQNNKTWTSSQYEDLKYVLYRAKFKHDTLTIALKNNYLFDEKIVTNPIETEAGSNKVRIYSDSHGMNISDKLKLNLGENTWLNFTATTGQLAISHVLTTVTGFGTVLDIKTTQNGTLDCLLTNITGHFIEGQSFTSNSFSSHGADSYLISNFNRASSIVLQSNNVVGTVNQTFNPLLNGIPIDELNNEVNVVAVDSNNSFIIESVTPATVTGRTGGNLIINPNKRYDLFNISGSYTINNTDENWVLKGIGHSMNGLNVGSDYIIQEAKTFRIGEDTPLKQSYKFANKLNEVTHLPTDSSMRIESTFKAKTLYASPVINVDTFSFVGIVNKVDFIDPLIYNVAPNGTNRLVSELTATGGVSSFKYITKAISLKNPALDMKIMLDVYKQNDSDFELYVKYTTPWSPQKIDEVSWVKIEGYDKNFISRDLTDFREIEMTLSEIMTATFGTIEFNCFRVKIIGKSKNPANPPMFKNLRIIALT